MEDERSKKLAAGRDRLAKFQKKKKKKKTKEPKAPDPEKVQDTTVESAPSFYEDRPNGTDSVDEFSAGSSDLLGSNSDILSSLSEIDQRSIGTDDLCQDSDASQLDAEVARLELGEARSRIHQLEESLLGKQTALTLLQNELSELRSKVNNNTDHSTTNGQVIEDNQNTQVNGSNQEAELRAALEQYNIKIQEFQQALKQRDEVIEQLTANMQTVAQSRDAVQADATAQINQLSGHIQTLQDQLKQTGESLSNQSREQVSSLAEELGLAQNQVTALQQNVADKDAIMKQLADRYTQKAQEVIELAEERDDMKRKNHGEISALQQKLKEATGEVSPVDREDSLLKLQAELDESYGSQIVMIKQQLEDKHQQELGLWKQRYDEMERIAAASSDSNLMRTELENQLKEANERLAEKDKEILVARGDNENLSLKLANLAASHQKHLDELEANHRNELDFVREEAKKRTQEHLDEVQKELESTQGELDTSLSELEEERKKSAEVEEELAEKALNTSSLQDNLTKEIGILATELKRKDDEIQELNQVRTNLHDQLNKLTSDREEHNAQYQSQIHDLSTEYSKLQAEIMEIRAEKESPEGADITTLQNKIEDDLRTEYEDRMEDLNIAHAAAIQQIRSELSFEHESALKKEKLNLQTQFEQKLENASVSKQHEFVAELQKVREELSNKFEADFNEKLEEERAKWMTNSSGPLGGGDHESESKCRLQAEVQELSEARDALMTQIESTTHEKEVLQEELRHVMTENDNLVEMAAPLSPRELSSAPSTLEDAQLSNEVESLRDSLEKTEEEKGDMEKKMSELEERLALSESERRVLTEEIERMSPQLESLTQERDQLLSVKEELQHQLEAWKKDLDSSEAKVSDLQESLAVAESDKQTLMEEIEGMKPRLEAKEDLENQLDAMRKEHVVLEQKNSDLETRLARSESEMQMEEELKDHPDAKGEDTMDLEKQISDLTERLAASESEKQTMTDEIASMTRHMDQLLTDKEELQHRLEAQEKEHEGEMMEVMAEKESVEAELEKAIAEVRQTRKTSESSPEIEQLQETLSELARLQEKGSKVDLLEGELQALRERLQDLEEHVCEGEDGSDSDQLEVLQDQLMSQQQMVNNLTEELRLAREKVGGLKAQQGGVGDWEEEVSALKTELQNLHREKEHLVEDLSEKESELESINAIVIDLEAEADLLKTEKKEIAEGVQELKELNLMKDNEIEEKDKQIELLKHQLDKISGDSVGVQAGRDEDGVLNGTVMIDNAGHIPDDPIESSVCSDVPELTELRSECDDLRSVVSDKDKEIQGLLLETDQKVSQIQALTNDIDLMKQVIEESVAREIQLVNALDVLGNDLEERKSDIGAVMIELGSLDERMGKLGEQMSLVQGERDTLLDQTEELSRNLADVKNHVSVLEEELSETVAERDLYFEKSTTLENELKFGMDEMGEGSHKNSDIDGTAVDGGEETVIGLSSPENEDSTEQADGVNDNRNASEDLCDLMGQIDRLKERLDYTEREGIREKKEYDKRLVLTEAELVKSSSLQTVLTAQMNAQRKMFEDDTQRLVKEIDRLQAELAMKPVATLEREVFTASEVDEDCDLQEVLVESPDQVPVSHNDILKVHATSPDSQEVEVAEASGGRGLHSPFSPENDSVDILWQEVVGSHLEDIPAELEAEVEEKTFAPEVVEEALNAEHVVSDLSSIPRLGVSERSSYTEVENLWQEVVSISLDITVTEVQNEISEEESEFGQVEEEIIVADHVSQLEERIVNLVGRIGMEAPTSDHASGGVLAPSPTFLEEPSTSDVDREFEQLWQEVGQLKEESKFKEDELLKMERHAQLMSLERDDALRELGEARTKQSTLLEALEQKEKDNVNLVEEISEVKEHLKDTLADRESVKQQRDMIESQLADLEESLELMKEKDLENMVLKEELEKAKGQLEEALLEREAGQGSKQDLDCQLSDPEELSKMLETKELGNAALKEELASDSRQPSTEMELAQEIQATDSNSDSVRMGLNEEGSNQFQEELEKVRGELQSVLVDREAIQGQKEELEKEILELRESQCLLEGDRESYYRQLEELKEKLPEIKETLVEEVDSLDSQIKSTRPVETFREDMNKEDIVGEVEGPHDENLLDPRHDRDSEITEEEVLNSEIRNLQDELEETKEVYAAEQSLLKEALEEGKTTPSPPVDEPEINSGRQVDMLTDLLDQKEQQEKEMLAEKNIQIRVLQEANARLEKELEALQTQLEDVQRDKGEGEKESQGEGRSVDDNVSKEQMEHTAEDIVDESEAREELNTVDYSSEDKTHTTDSSQGLDLGTADDDSQGLADRLEESIAREEALMEEKDLLLEKIAEQEEIHRRLVEEKGDLQRQLSDKRRLESLLLEKDRLEQELARQKTTMDADLSDLETQLAQRENHLLREKCQLQEELKQKDLLLRRWEVGFREHQMKLRNQEMHLERQYSEQLARVQDELRDGQSSHLEKLRTEVERRHAEAISRLKRDLHQEFALREARLNESHLSDVAAMKSQHSSQVQWSSF